MIVSAAATGLKRLREKAKMSVREVADAIGRPPSTYASYEDKFKKPFLPLELVNALVPIFEGKGVSPDETLALAGIKGRGLAASGGSSPKEIPSPEVTSPIINPQQMPLDVPILGSAICGDDGLFELNGQIQDHARRPPKLMGVKDAYALWVMGESMFPWRKNGGLVYVHPHQPVNVGDYVVVQLKPTSDGGAIPAYIKELSRRTAKDLRLLQYNPNEEIVIPTSKVGAIHRIIDWSELMGI